MADDAFPPPKLPDENVLIERARAAGVDPDMFTPLTRRAVLREFRTPAEQADMDARFRGEIEEDAAFFNALYDKHGIWNEKIRGW